jgi:hypothetical protein
MVLSALLAPDSAGTVDLQGQHIRQMARLRTGVQQWTFSPTASLHRVV